MDATRWKRMEGLRLIIQERTRDNAIPFSANPLGSKHAPQRDYIVRDQLQAFCPDILFQVGEPLRPRDRNDVRSCANSQASAIWAGVAL